MNDTHSDGSSRGLFWFAVAVFVAFVVVWNAV